MHSNRRGVQRQLIAATDDVPVIDVPECKEENNTVLRNLLHERLKGTSQISMLKENDGKHVIGHSWSQRFWRRNGFSNRAATSKMRDLPADFNEKKETYIRLAKKLLHKYNIPADLVHGIDDINALFCISK